MAEAVGHNSGMTDDDRKTLFFINRNEWVRLVAAKKAADAALKNHGKQIKADLGENGMAQIKEYERARTPEGKAKIQAEIEAKRDAWRWAGLPVNTQADLFGKLAPIDEEAFEAGEESGLCGETLNNPHDPTTLAGKKYEEGWKSGQAKLGAGIKKKEAAANTDERIANDDPFADPEAEAA
ncbi:MAG: hypothetical protein WA973_06365 [Mesorhizobium sp.]